VEGFESPYGLELLSTVHWVVTHEGVTQLDEVTQCIHAWNQHKRQFTSRQIAIAARQLETQGWLTPAIN
jgi:hypothetical protein